MTDAPGGPGWWQAADGLWYAPSPPAPAGSSDHQVTPEWWLASDGRWYPPAAPQSTVTPYPAEPARSVARGLSGALQGFFWATAALAAITGIIALTARSAYDRWQAGGGSISGLRDLVDADDALSTSTFLSWLGGVVVLVLMIIWSNHAHKATQALWHGRRKWSSGWTVGGWFIPFANLVIPKLVLDETERIALAPRRDGRVVQRREHPTTVGWIWWILFVVGLVAGRIVGARVIDDWDGSGTSLGTGYTLVAVGHGLLAVSAVFGALYVRRIGQALSPEAMSQAQHERYATG